MKPGRSVLAWLAARRRSWQFGAAAALLAVAAVLTGWWGAATLSALPRHQVEITVEEGLPWSISPEAVELLAAQDPVPSWKPLTLHVTGDYFTYGEKRAEGTEDLPADVVLSVHADERHGLDRSGREDIGVIARPDAPGQWRGRGSLGREVESVYLDNLAAGRGPSAVLAAAQAAGSGLYSGPPRIPAVWIGACLGLGALALAAGVLWLRARRREAEVRRAFQQGQADLARVLLAGEALDVVTLTLPAGARTSSFRALRRSVDEGAEALVRDQVALARNLQSTAHRDWAAAAQQVPDFRRRAQALVDQLNAVVDSAEVLGRSAGGQRVLDRVLAPLVTGSRQLIARLRTAPAGAVAAGHQEDLEQALTALLTLVQDHREGPDAGPDRHAAGLTDRTRSRWRSAERRLGAAAQAIRADLERFPLGHGVADDWARRPEDSGLQELRGGLGLGDEPAAVAELARAQATARALLGDLDGVDRPLDGGTARRERGREPARPTSGQPAGRASGKNPGKTPVRGPGGPRKDPDSTAFAGGLLRRGGRQGTRGVRLSLSGWALVTILAVGATQPLAAAWADRAIPDPVFGLEGSEAIRSLVIDGPDLGLSPERIVDQVDGRFPAQLDVVVAVRAAESYVTAQPSNPEDPVEEAFDPTGVQVSPRSVLDGLERMRQEFPERTDPETGELWPDQVIIPVLVWASGDRGVQGAMLGSALPVGAVSTTASALGRAFLEDPGALDGEVAARLVDAGRDLQLSDVALAAAGQQGSGTNALRTSGQEADLDEGSLAILLTLSLTALALTLVSALESLLSLAWGLQGLGGLSRAGARLRAVRRELSGLLLDLDDSRLAGVAVLGAGPAGSPQEAEQRLYERSLDAAWRQARSLGNMTLGQRIRGAAEPGLSRLERATALLRDRDADVAERADRVLDLTRRF
ncbi:hypothetical protein AB0K08_07285 [Citricoccus sp. NPDC055426]|uniref:hypothetical protein n=1 Tax=Citricoccus sp. NPDC055426 TaxID=3155536 RepID=UPI00341452C0